MPDIYTFVYDITAGIPAVVEEIDEDSGTTTLYYREPDGSLVARARYGVYRFYHFDALGSTRILTDGSGNVTDRYSYDAWGNVTPDPNNLTPDNPYQYVGQLGYYTHYQEPEFGLLQLGVRFYNAETGRFTQRDRGWSESVGYSYINDRPMIAADPTGLSWDGPPPAKITAKMCRDACEESGFNPTVCRQACALLKNASCAGLKALINHLRRHQSHVAQKMADALMAVYFYFNCDIGKKACSTGIRQ